ncbi:hypothetical protein BPO_p0037 (plasmid) [Bergeyella porcorum]|uniref:Fibronectin type-III domain-containing protein n=1 Tax=Bergeyella porcorum TaxID=1735111 RepID=A0AAU0F8H7_9FLAO
MGEYATSTDNKLQLQVLMTDLQQPSHQVAIKFFLEGGTTNTPIASSAPFIQGYNPFTLFPGQQITLSNVDLRSLFALDNLSGIDPLSYSKALPDGVYSFCFQAYDWFTKNNLSQKACAIAFFNQYEPPFLTLPQNGERIPALSPYDNGAAAMIFQWQPRQIAPNTRYIFTLKELWDLERDPISGFLAAPPFWQEEVFSPTLFYGLDKAQLIPGKRYAWQVQAKSGNPVYSASPTEDNGTYKNNGLSEIFYFDYTENCKTPSLLTAQNAGRGKVKIQWMLNGASAGDYNVQYRKRGTSGEWITAKSYQSPYFITGLEDLTEYEYRVGSVCGNLQNFNSDAYNTNAGNAYAYSAIQYFTTDSKDKSNENFQCGIMPAIDISNKTIYQGALGVNDVIMAGDFPVTITRADGIGNYSGEGYIVVPYLGDTKLKVSFNNIQINTDKKLIAGTIETTYDPSEKAVIDINGFEDLLKDLGAIFIKENPTKEDEDKYKDYKNQLDFYFNNVDDLGMSDEDKKQFEELKTNLFYASIENMSSSEKEKAIEATQKAQNLFEKYKESINALAEKKNKFGELLDNLKEGKLLPPKAPIGTSNENTEKPLTVAKLRDIQQYCQSNRNNKVLWQEIETNKKALYNGYSVCLYDNTPNFYYIYKRENYWLSGKDWFTECTSQQVKANNSDSYKCINIYNAKENKYIFANLQVGKSTGEEAAEFLTWLFVRDIPLTIVGGGTSTYAAVANLVGVPILDYLEYKGEITTKENLALQIVLVVAEHGKVKLSKAQIDEISKQLAEKFKAMKQSLPQLIEEMKTSLRTVTGKTIIVGKIGDQVINSVTGDIRKFSEYALTNPSKKGLFVDSWGYKLEDAQKLLDEYTKQAIEAVKKGKVVFKEVDKYGNKVYKIKTILKTPNRGIKEIDAGWIIKPEKIDELILSTPLADR